MNAIGQIITEFFIMVLCATASPVDQQEIRLDRLSLNGSLQTMVIQREETGFTIYEEGKEKLHKIGSILPKKGGKNAFICELTSGKKETIDLGSGIKEFNIEDLRSKKRLRLKTSGGASITVERSGKVTYFKFEGKKGTFITH